MRFTQLAQVMPTTGIVTSLGVEFGALVIEVFTRSPAYYGGVSGE